MLLSVWLSLWEMEKLQVVHHQLSQNGLGRIGPLKITQSIPELSQELTHGPIRQHVACSYKST